MKKFMELISEEMGKAFEAAGYQADLGKVTISNRPDLCEYQCDGGSETVPQSAVDDSQRCGGKITGKYSIFGSQRCCAGLSEPQGDGKVR